VDGTEHREKFATRTLADARRAEPLTATRKGESSDTETGPPVSEVRERNRTGRYAHARAHAARKWPTAAARHRASIAERLRPKAAPPPRGPWPLVCPTGREITDRCHGCGERDL